MFGKKAREIQRLRRILKDRIILENRDGEILLDVDFERLHTIGPFLVPTSRRIYPTFFEYVNLRIKRND